MPKLKYIFERSKLVQIVGNDSDKLHHIHENIKNKFIQGILAKTFKLMIYLNYQQKGSLCCRLSDLEDGHYLL
jgi:hypothetical protein